MLPDVPFTRHITHSLSPFLTLPCCFPFSLLSLGLSVPGYGSLLRRVLSEGLFFRSASNRRERNYW